MTAATTASVRLVHVSDTHLVAPGSETGRHAALDPAAVDPAANLIAALGLPSDDDDIDGDIGDDIDADIDGDIDVIDDIDVIVHTGDITDDGSPEATTQVAELLRARCQRVMMTAGNHDRIEVVREVAPDDVITVGAWQIVRLDTAVPGVVHGAIDAARAAATLDRLSGPCIAIAMHHPLRSNSTHPWFQLRGGDELESVIIARPRVRLVLSGHTHQQYRAVLPGGCLLAGGPSTYYSIDHAGERWGASRAPVGVSTMLLHPDGAVELDHH